MSITCGWKASDSVSTSISMLTNSKRPVAQVDVVLLWIQKNTNIEETVIHRKQLLLPMASVQVPTIGPVGLDEFLSPRAVCEALAGMGASAHDRACRVG